VTAADDRDRWTVLYDADCGLCTWLLALLLRRDRDLRVRPLALHDGRARELLADLSPEQQLESWHLISPAGERLSAGAAAPALLVLLPHGRVPAGLLARFPAPTEVGYRWVAKHRSGLSRLVPEVAKRRARELVRSRAFVPEG
jgi:predicted DCC family thiol-disulfide oxidoreductase YuxK